MFTICTLFFAIIWKKFPLPLNMYSVLDNFINAPKMLWKVYRVHIIVTFVERTNIIGAERTTPWSLIMWG